MESNPIMLRISREINKLRAWEESSTSVAESISIGLSGIADLYSCICNVLSLPLTQQALSLHQHQQSVSELLQRISKLLEICSATRGIVLQMKESSRDLQSALGGSQTGCEPSISSYISSRKMIMKSAKQLLLSLKRTEGESFAPSRLLGDGDSRVSAVVQALRCVSIISISIHEALLLFLGSKPKYGGRRGLISKLISKGKRACEDEKLSRNELENVDVTICGLFSDSGCVADEKIPLICKRLEVLEVGIEGMQSGLDNVFRQLTQARFLLLKVFSS